MALRPSTRRRLRTLHLWLALIAFLPLSLQGVTGCILVFKDRLEPVFPSHAVSSSSGQPHSPEAIVNAARAAAPEGHAASRYRPGGNGKAALVRFLPEGDDPLGVQVAVDPVSLAVLSRDVYAAPLNRVALLHGNLLLREYGGKTVVGWSGVALLVLSASGLVLWWPRKGQWKRALSVRRGAKGYVLLRDVHSLLGGLGFTLLLIMSATGVLMAFSKPLTPVIASLLPMRYVDAAKGLPQAPLLGLDAAIEKALADAPQAKLAQVQIPARPGQPYRVHLRPSGAQKGQPLLVLSIDPASGNIIGRRDPMMFRAGDALLAYARVIHAAEGYGPIWRGAVFLAGFLPLSLSVAGIGMWLMRTRRLSRNCHTTTHSV